MEKKDEPKDRVDRMSLPEKEKPHLKQQDTVGDPSEHLVTRRWAGPRSERDDVVAAEAFFALATNLFQAIADTPNRTIVLTSPGSREGKSIICANLGVVLAQASTRTLIVDCNFRGPVQHQVFGLSNSPGIANVLTGERELHQVWQETAISSNLSVLTTGPTPLNPAELLGSQRFPELLDRARREFEYVLVDAPSAQPGSDALILAPQGDCVLLVIDYRGTQKKTAWRSMRRLDAVGATVLGTVVNNARVSETSLE